MIYVAASSDVLEVVGRMMSSHHKELLGLGVTVSASFVFAERDDLGYATGSALEHDGYPATATIRITKLKERVQGRTDAEILIDGPIWPRLPIKQRDALIDHELEHLELVEDFETLEPKLDDHGRPMLRMKKHDIQMGWFLKVADRHGIHSGEVIQARSVFTTHAETLKLQ